MHRREFLGALGFLGAGPAHPRAAGADPPAPEGLGVLVDLPQCIGCRKCEWACNEVNELPSQPLTAFEDKSVFAELRRPDADRFTVVNEEAGSGGAPLWVKAQCMHCLDPACASACLVSAFRCEDTGAVTYDADRCMGCRYCMVACPFQVPAYEYADALTPRVRKCTFCSERIAIGRPPACVEVCPPQCLTFGPRKELVRLAHRKIEDQPDRYVDHVYGEDEVGGTSWMYVSDRPFRSAGLPVLPVSAPPRLTEALQHGVFARFVPPLGLFGLLGLAAWLLRRTKGAEADANEPPDVPSTPVARRFWTPGVFALFAVLAVGLAAAAVRFVNGLGAATNLDDQWPWGIWIAIDVATGVALAAGGFTTAALAHVFHRDAYRAIARPALLSALLGYTFVVLGLLADLGRYYNVWHPVMPSMWSGQSVLFEVGMCVLIYLTVLYFEFIPIVTERLMGRIRLPRVLRRLEPPVERLVRALDSSFRRVMFLLVIAGVVLSCLHQSSLGSLMLLAPTKMHALWYTPVLPLLFLLSAIAVGFPVVIFESVVSARVFGRKPERDLLAGLARIVPVLLGIYLVVRVGDLVIRDVGALVLDGSTASWMFLLEVGLGVVVPFGLLLFERVRQSPPALLAAASLVMAGVVLNRINVFLVAYEPLYSTKPYFPSVAEVALTCGLVAGLLIAYRAVVSVLPVLPLEEVER